MTQTWTQKSVFPAVLLLVAQWFMACPPPGTPPKLQAKAPVRGYLAISVRVPAPHDVYVPGVSVRLVDAGTNRDVASAVTDLSGRFSFSPQKAGAYRICWDAKGYVSECNEQTFALAGEPLHVSKLFIRAQSQTQQEDLVLLSGKVLLADGSSPRRLEPLSNVNALATVTLFDHARTELQRVLVNNFDEYVLPAVPSRAPISIHAAIEGGSVDQEVMKEAGLFRAPQHDLQFRVRNHPPRLEGLVPLDNAGKRMQAISPGDTVRLLRQT
jgi:hypothetical protein